MLNCGRIYIMNAKVKIHSKIQTFDFIKGKFTYSFRDFFFFRCMKNKKKITSGLKLIKDIVYAYETYTSIKYRSHHCWRKKKKLTRLLLLYLPSLEVKRAGVVMSETVNFPWELPWKRIFWKRKTFHTDHASRLWLFTTTTAPIVLLIL